MMLPKILAFSAFQNFPLPEVRETFDASLFSDPTAQTNFFLASVSTSVREFFSPFGQISEGSDHIPWLHPARHCQI